MSGVIREEVGARAKLGPDEGLNRWRDYRSNDEKQAQELVKA